MITIQNLNKSFNKKQIFKNFNMEVSPGEFLGIVGKSGTGKTTLLNIVGTLDTGYSGILEIMGKKVLSRKDRVLLLRNDLGFIFQNYALIDNLSIKENLGIALKHKKISRYKKEEAITEALKEVGMDDYLNEKIYTLSGGEQQRIAISRILLKDPSLILADEPTGSLDDENRDVIISLFKKLNKEGKTILMVTHDKELTKFFSRTILL